MNEKRTFPWIEAAVVAVSGMGFVVLFRAAHSRILDDTMAWYDSDPALAVLGIVCLIGLVSLADAFLNPDGGTRRMGLEYLSAWNVIRRNGWLLRLLVAIGLFKALSALVTYGLIRIRPEMVSGFPISISSLHDYAVRVLPRELHVILQEALGGFFPALLRFESMSFMIVFAAYLVLLPGMHRRLAGRDEPDIRITANMLLPLAVMGLGLTAYLIIKSLGGDGDAFIFLSPAVNILPPALFLPMLIGGFVGSMKRMSAKRPVTTDSFVEDSARYYTRMLGLLSLIAVLYIVPIVATYAQVTSLGATSLFSSLHGWAYGLALLVGCMIPFAIARHDLRLSAGIRRGIRDLLAHWKAALRFFAVGVVIVSVVNSVLNALHASLPRLSAGGIGVSILIALASTFLAVFMAVAVWEFYRSTKLRRGGGG